MARREITQIFDDLDDSPLNENDAHVLRFSIDGSGYVMDVSTKNCEKFKDAIAPFIEKARPESISARRNSEQKYNPKDVREWAIARGYEVAVRGKLSRQIIDDYLAAHS
ncbi:MAG: Lsr2 family protein [Corynebacterium sp.]|uniref:Lsr2 n=1 Tax=Corynebacterium mustelae TaxID=571915 RepID=A0A0G3H801_9CORY|nr:MULTISPECIES: Lsr2 family protein [Corynebacterium]AKK07257.1 Lsr2 [Corynebacterium mustelae]MDO5099113.1 Lsr2 family protein [Corynebacterium sp.]